MTAGRKICLFNSCKAWGGGEKWYYDMACRLSDRGYVVCVVTNPETPLAKRLEEQALRVIQINITRASFCNPLKILKLRNLFVAERFRTIVLNLPSDLKAGGIAAKLAGVEKIIYRRGSAKPIRNSVFNRFLFKRIIDCVIANSQATRNTILQNNAELIAADRIHVIYNGLDLAHYDGLETGSLPLERKNEIVLGSAGRLSPQKNQKFLIDVARLLKQQKIDFKLLIAGEGKLRRILQRYALAAGLENEVVFLGFLSNIKDFMEHIDIFLLSSLWEGFGYVIVEAMASCKPVVSLDNSNQSEIIENDKTGYLVKENDAEQFAARIRALIDDGARRKAFGQNGRSRVEERFTIQRSLNALEQLL